MLAEGHGALSTVYLNIVSRYRKNYLCHGYTVLKFPVVFATSKIP